MPHDHEPSNPVRKVDRKPENPWLNFCAALAGVALFVLMFWAAFLRSDPQPTFSKVGGPPIRAAQD